jgi:hypothetical protein
MQVFYQDIVLVTLTINVAKKGDTCRCESRRHIAGVSDGT